MIKFDLRDGILRRWKILLVPVLIFACGSLLFLGECRDAGVRPTVGVMLLRLFKGCAPHIQEERFEMPESWFAIMSCALLTTLFYPSSCMEEAGTQILIRSKSRRRWWYSKCLWCMVSTVLYFALGAMTLALVCVLSGGSADLSGAELFSWVSQSGVSQWATACNMLFVPALVTAALALVQMLIAVRFNQIIAFILCEAVLVFSAVVQTPLAIGNYTMAQRCGVLVSGGLDFSAGAAMAAAICVFCLFAGGEIFRRQDVLNVKNKGE